jgi:23S rRNA (adenine2503-C2)-methyltransferase
MKPRTAVAEKAYPITELSPAELGGILKGLGQPEYRLGQIRRWLYGRAVGSFDEMTDVPEEVRDYLTAAYRIPRPGVLETAVSPTDGTARYLFRLDDGLAVEAVYLPGEDHDTVCLSTQVGCRFGCSFCATASLGFQRNLTGYEIAVQFAIIRNEKSERNVRNAVLMGQGEPLDNYDAAVGAVQLLQEYQGLGARRITISTVGLADKIRRLADDGVRAKLAVSLNAARQDLREMLMPVAKKVPLDELVEALLYYYKITKTRPTLEYVLIGGVNDTVEDARALVKLSRRVPCKVNVIRFNPWPGCSYGSPSEEIVDAFLAEVAAGPMALTVRENRGADVAAACGQLARRVADAGQEESDV